MLFGGLHQVPTSGSGPVLPPLFSLPPPLESGSLMPQLAGLLPPNFPSFMPPSSSSSSEDSADQNQQNSDSGPLSLAKAWLSSLPGLSGTQNGNSSNGNAMPNPSPTNFAAMEDLLKSLPNMSGSQQQQSGSGKNPPLFPPMSPEILAAMMHGNPQVMNLLWRSQALLASQGCVPPPPMPQPGSPPQNSTTNYSLPVAVTSSGNNIKSDEINNIDSSSGTAKRKRTRPVYIPPQMRPPQVRFPLKVVYL